MAALIIGFISIILGVLGVVKWISDFVLVLRGALPSILVCGGIIAVIFGVMSVKDSIESRKIEQEIQKERDK